ncbi:lysophospholipid acyltransferase family protein [Zavarzinella formosa]|uniref:lysophospholipid acyltransferase family protein n=1 Tax=Zavarzinella formosa TaxID=360055 RepID=UPI0003110161|nr:lysophospholipid acyltransferase family protein [Zavarzinella formosa]
MRVWVAHRWYDFCKFLTWLFLSVFASLRTNGHANMPKTGAVLLLANHASFFDPPLLGVAVPRYCSHMARKSLFGKKFWGWLIASLDGFPVESKGFSREGLMSMIAKIEEGKPVTMFPEGERTHDGQMHEFKPGLLLLLKKVQCPIVPIGVAGTYQTFSRHHKFPSFCTIFTPADDRCIALSVGKPVMPEEYGQWSRDEILQKLFEVVQAQEAEAKKLQRKRRI